MSQERQPRTHQPQPRPTSQCQEAPTPASGVPAPRPTRPPPTPPTPPPTPPTTPPTPRAGVQLPIRPTAPTFRRSLLLQLLPQLNAMLTTDTFYSTDRIKDRVKVT